jgi:peptidoglycan/xylan/chitin deacetylase (PgdA/CDA1 family)
MRRAIAAALAAFLMVGLVGCGADGETAPSPAPGRPPPDPTPAPPASDTGAAAILDTLARHGLHASFFVTGDFARRYPAQVRAMAAGGHLVGNHSDTHPDFTTLPPDAQDDQLARATAAIAPLTGIDPAPWFRFPFGASNPAAVGNVNGVGYAAIGWTVDTLGWQGTSGGQSVDTVVARIIAAARPGAIVLAHVGANPDDGSTLDADALPIVIDRLQSTGYRFVRLDGRT